MPAQKIRKIGEVRSLKRKTGPKKKPVQRKSSKARRVDIAVLTIKLPRYGIFDGAQRLSFIKSWLSS